MKTAAWLVPVLVIIAAVSIFSSNSNAIEIEQSQKIEIVYNFPAVAKEMILFKDGEEFCRVPVTEVTQTSDGLSMICVVNHPGYDTHEYTLVGKFLDDVVSAASPVVQWAPERETPMVLRMMTKSRIIKITE